MKTISIPGQHLPISIQLLSRISAYAHIFESLAAIILFWLFPHLGPKMPELQTTYRPRPRQFLESRNSAESVSTLMSEDMIYGEDVESEIRYEENVKVRRKFYMLSAPMMKSKSLSLMPFTRRMSLPAKRLSETITTTLSNPFQSPSSSPFSSPLPSPAQTPSSILESACYFSPPGPNSECVTFDEPEEIIDTVVEQIDDCEDLEEELPVLPAISLRTAESVTKMKRATKKAKSLLRLHRQS